MKKQKPTYIRPGSIADIAIRSRDCIADFVIRNRKGLVMIAAASVILAGMSAATLAFATVEPAEPVEPVESTISEPEFVEISTEKFDISTMNQPTPQLWDVPLDAELQIFITELCAKNHIAPELVLAMIERESTYRADAIGDSGNSFGLMQIQKKFHLERMERLGVDNLLDPYQNVQVGIDYLAELLGKGNTAYALMSYNGGPDYGKAMVNRGEISEYAEAVLQAAELLQRG